jgi:hypothetical protein
MPKAFACPEHDVSVLPINRALSAEEARVEVGDLRRKLSGLIDGGTNLPQGWPPRVELGLWRIPAAPINLYGGGRRTRPRQKYLSIETKSLRGTQKPSRLRECGKNVHVF